MTHLVFGCESGELGPLQAAADCLDSPAYHVCLRRFTGEGMTFAAARQAAVRTLAGEAAECLSSPNNALAVEYLRALKALGSSMEPLALPRVGAAHDSGEESGYPSASAVREKILTGGDWRAVLPETSAAILSREIEAGRGPVCMENCQRAVLSQLRRMPEEDFRAYDGGNEGLYHRFYAAVHGAVTVDEILSAVKTKRYPLARLRRMLLQAYLGAPQAAQGRRRPTCGCWEQTGGEGPCWGGCGRPRPCRWSPSPDMSGGWGRRRSGSSIRRPGVRTCTCWPAPTWDRRRRRANMQPRR